MKVLITGAGGFIGRSLSAYLGSNNALTLLAPTHQELDVADESSVDNYVDTFRPDIIIHTANVGGGRNTIGLQDIVQTNLRMFFNIAKQAPKVQRIIQLGSGAEYGKHKPIIDVVEEDALAAFPKDDYGFYKSVCSRYIDKTDNMVNLRIFGCYGELEDYRYKFISNAIVKNLLGLPITINQNVFFDYIYIDDLVKMIEYFLFNESNFKAYNITRGEKTDLLSLAKTINQVSEKSSDICIVHEGLNHEYSASNARIMQEMQSFVFTSHHQAIKNMIDFFTRNFAKIDQKIISQDPYLEKCSNIWKAND